MNNRLVALGIKGREYLGCSLADGQTLARAAVDKLAGMTVVAIAPSGMADDCLAEFSRGGRWRLDRMEVAAELTRLFPAATLLVALPLRRPDDPDLVHEEFRTIFYKSEVYAACKLDESLDVIDATLRAHDPSYLYNAFIVDHERNAESTLDEIAAGGSERILAILAGAYDGEGFVAAFRDST